MSQAVTPAVIVTRHPDFEDDISSFWMPKHIKIYVDLGASFDVTKLGADDRAQIEEWISGYADIARQLIAGHNHEAFEHLASTLAQVYEEVTTDEPNVARQRVNELLGF